MGFRIKNLNTPPQNQQGFTLIELLVVISIISFLASIVLVAVKQARSQAVDARRMADALTLQKALDLFYQDKGFYPTSSQPVLISTMPEWNAQIRPQLDQSYLQALPQSVNPGTVSIPISRLISQPGEIGELIYIDVSSRSGGYGQLGLIAPDGYACVKSGSSVIGIWLNSRSQSYGIYYVTIAGKNYAFNTILLNGNYEYPYSGSQAACPSTLNP